MCILLLCNLVDIYYRHIKEEFVNGTIEREKLYNYFDASKKMFDLQGNAEFPVDPFYLISPAAYAMGYDGSYDFLVGNMYSVSSGPMQMDKIAEQINGVVDYPSGEYKDYYITCENMAISSKSLNKDIAAEYIKNTLSEECQSDLYGAIAFRVNKKALTDYSKYDFNLWGQEDGEISDEEQKTFEDYLNKTKIIWRLKKRAYRALFLLLGTVLSSSRCVLCHQEYHIVRKAHIGHWMPGFVKNFIATKHIFLYYA